MSEESAEAAGLTLVSREDDGGGGGTSFQLQGVGVTAEGYPIFINDQATAGPESPYFVQLPDGEIAHATPQQVAPFLTPQEPAGRQPSFSFQTAVDGSVWRASTGGGFEQVLPAGSVPQGLQVDVDRNGDLVAFDPANPAGTFQVVQPGFAQPTQSPQEQQQFQTDERLGGERFRAGERVGGEQFQAGERLGGERFRGRQADIDRAARAGEFAATHGLNERIEDRQATESRFDMQRMLRDQQLAGAGQLSSLIGQTDPGAIEAFLAGGGGVISNALASGRDALSDNALLPAARTLRAIEQPNPFSLQNANPTSSGGIGAAMAGVRGVDPATAPLVPGTVRYDEAIARARERSLAVLASGGSTGSSVGSAGAIADQQLIDEGQAIRGLGGGIASRDSFASAGDAVRFSNPFFNSGIKPTISAAHGFSGTVTEPTTLQVGENGPEHVQVTPNAPNPFDLDAIRSGLVTPADQPFLDRIRTIREGVQVPGLNPFDVAFRNVAPTLMNRFFQARQTKKGISVADQVAEAERFTLPGVRRGSFAFGV